MYKINEIEKILSFLSKLYFINEQLQNVAKIDETVYNLLSELY